MAKIIKIRELDAKILFPVYGFPLHYYDNKKKGEVDFLIDDDDRLQVLKRP